MSQSTFSRIENGQTKPRLDSVSKLLSATGNSHHVSDIIESASPKLAAMVRENLSHNIETPFIGGEVSQYFKKPIKK